MGPVAAPPTADPLPDGPPETKGRRGRKSKADKAKEEAQEVETQRLEREKNARESVPYLKELLAWPFDIVASRRGQFWKLEPDEKERGAYALALLAEKYLPDFMRRYQEEILAAMVLGTIIGVRVREDRRRYGVKRPRDNGTPTERQDDATSSDSHPTT